MGERIFAVGDIHGCYFKLDRLMDKIKLNFEKDVLLFLGDYIDRGDQSKEVVEYLVQLKRKQPSTVFLLGNHEQMLQEFLGGEHINQFLVNGGKKTLDSYLGDNRLYSSRDPRTIFPPEHLDFFNSLCPHYETEDYIFVHAGLREGIPLESQDLFDLLWIREDFYFSKFDFGKTVVFGHTPFQKPFIYKNKIGIDTGAAYGNKLTCLELPDMRFTSV
ncbi:MAG: serine/threonine protein phosphatase [Deltaproteobacteria bacterium]|nr:serine/threonine protein phosphatase [Deltaproteobacteria bacterium]